MIVDIIDKLIQYFFKYNKTELKDAIKKKNLIKGSFLYISIVT